MKGRASRADRPIPGGGALVLGQSSRKPDGTFDLSNSFVGEVAFVNIWHHVMRRDEIKNYIYEDCKIIKCGDVVEWADFRSGTRGAMKIKWPSAIYPLSGNILLNTYIPHVYWRISSNKEHTLLACQSKELTSMLYYCIKITSLLHFVADQE